MPVYKVTYFDVRARGEPIRWLLSYLGEEFIDNRIKHSDWATLKKDVLFGKLPVLDVDGDRIYQTGAICRFLGKKAKLAGDNDWESIQIDSIQGTIDDLMAAMGPIRRAEGEEKEKLMNQLKTETVPYYFGIYNDNAKSGYLANGKLSWVDIFFICIVDSMEGVLGEGCLDNFPNLKALKAKVVSLPGIKEWIAKRP
uniref:glutathione transferase n=3 Tax=Lygus hesperus TaxID=30085 RepID=A0A0A9VYJ0_LYGHE